MAKEDLQASKIARALSVERRLLLLGWLRNPDMFFRNRLRNEGAENAVALANIQQRWNVSEATARMHIGLLNKAGLVLIERSEGLNWVSRNDENITAARQAGYLYLR